MTTTTTTTHYSAAANIPGFSRVPAADLTTGSAIFFERFGTVEAVGVPYLEAGIRYVQFLYSDRTGTTHRRTVPATAGIQVRA
jgi:hypothetical protein